MKTRTLLLVGLVLVALTALVPALNYDAIPDPVPTHWNLRGEADGFTPKPWGAFLGTFTLLFSLGVFLAIPNISPAGYEVNGFPRAYFLMAVGTMIFIAVVTSAGVLQSIGLGIDIDATVTGGIGALFMLIGNLLGKITRNFFVGIRTPWTLASEEVWLRTHRMGGKTFFSAGVVILIASVFGARAAFVLPAILIAALVPVVYSYVIYRRLQREAISGT